MKFVKFNGEGRTIYINPDLVLSVYSTHGDAHKICTSIYSQVGTAFVVRHPIEEVVEMLEKSHAS